MLLYCACSNSTIFFFQVSAYEFDWYVCDYVGPRACISLLKGFQIHQVLTRILDSDEQGGVQEAPNGVFSSSFGRICNINTIYNIFPDGNSNPNPQNLSQADKYLTNMAVTDPTKERDTVRLLLKRSCLSPGGTCHQPWKYKPAPVQKSTQYPGRVPGGAERTCFVNSLNSSRHARHHGQSRALLWCE